MYDLKKLNDAAQIHKCLLDFAEKLLSTSISYLELVTSLHSKTEELCGCVYSDKTGLAFPIGVNVNETLAHDSANRGDIRQINKGDVVKIDIGVHIDGNIIDSARTFVCGKESTSQIDSLIQSTVQATTNAIELCRPGVLINDMSRVIEETIKNHSFNPVNYLCGHSIGIYKIHSSQSIPCVATSRVDYIQEGLYAIETFATTGPSECIEGEICNHFMATGKKGKFKFRETSKLNSWISKKRNGLAFSPLWFDFSMSLLEDLCSCDVVRKYPPLSDAKGSLTSQHEHTIYVGKDKTIILE